MTAFVQKVRANTRARPRVVAGLLLACLLWSYWPTLRELWDVWQVDDDCSVGQLVPLVAIWLAWRERDALRRTVLRPHWAGAALLVSSQVVRFAGIYYA
ncbi:MAG: archaeosortase/exosortase family protein, partial [Planctomycetota bacterium]